jgi:Carboxypeptidase regulatory-like domain
MKKKLLMLLTGLMVFVAANASGGDEPGNPNGKKDDLNGIVTHSETKKPLEGVSVTAILISKKEKIVATDEEGEFSFDSLKPGMYKFVFEKAGFKKITKEKVIVKTEEAFQLNIEMIELSDFDILPSPIGIGGGF